MSADYGPEFAEWTVNIHPVGKPRMTKRDVWAKRPIVLRYRAFADEFRLKAPPIPKWPKHIGVYALIPLPKSTPKSLVSLFVGEPHFESPDVDNIAKSIMDVLYKQDKTIGILRSECYWIHPSDTPLIMVSIQTHSKHVCDYLEKRLVAKELNKLRNAKKKGRAQ